MKTAVEQLMIDSFGEDFRNTVNDHQLNSFQKALEKEKEQIKKAFSDGQETPINHPTLPHYSNEEYYNDNYNN